MNERVTRALRRDARAWFGIGVVAVIVLLAVLAPLVSHQSSVGRRTVIWLPLLGATRHGVAGFVCPEVKVSASCITLLTCTDCGVSVFCLLASALLE